MDEYMNDLQQELPKVVVITPGNLDDNIEGFLDKNKYQLLYSSNTEDLHNSSILYYRQ
jgi:hypothetical protein